jgi:hypothetical protein
LKQYGEDQPDDFFPDSVSTEKEALSFLKKLTAMSVSTILYHRGWFPDTDYTVRVQGRQELHLLEKNAVSPAAKQIVSLVISTFKAIDKKLLSSIVIGIVEDPDRPDYFRESYSIKLQYFNPQTYG